MEAVPPEDGESAMKPSNTVGATVLAFGVIVVVWQALAQLFWTIDTFDTCYRTTAYGVCQEGRDYLDVLAFFDDRAFTMFTNYLFAVALAGMVFLLVIGTLWLRVVILDFLFYSTYTRWLRRNTEKELADSRF